MEIQRISTNSDHAFNLVVAIYRNMLYFHHLSVFLSYQFVFVCLSVCYQDGGKTIRADVTKLIEYIGNDSRIMHIHFGTNLPKVHVAATCGARFAVAYLALLFCTLTLKRNAPRVCL